MANLYHEYPRVVYSLPDFLTDVRLLSIPNDTYFSNQYYLRNTGQTGGVNGADINVTPAWDITTGSSSITIAVIDEGGMAQEDIPSSRIVAGYDYYDIDSDPSAGGNEAHGMACAGVVGATQNNSTGISGVAPNCRIMFLRVFNSYGQGTTNNGFTNAIDFAWQHGADVLSNSWGIYPQGIWYDNIAAAINRALTQGRGGRGSVVVFAASNSANRNNGNYGFVTFPATVPGVIAVGATDKSNNIQYYSPRGTGTQLSVVTPSGDLGYLQPDGSVQLRGDVWSTDIGGQPGWNDGNYGTGAPTYYTHYTWGAPGGDAYPPGNYTAHFGGTSAACPQVSGAAALMLTINPNLAPSQVKTIVQNTAADMGASGYDTDFGYGRLNAGTAVYIARPLMAPISGPRELAINQQGTWTVSATGSTDSYTYAWFLRANSTGGQWIGPLSTTNSYSTTMHSSDGYLDLRADVTSGVQQTSTTRHVTCTDCSGGPLTPQVAVDSAQGSIASTDTPGGVTIEQNYPNPFNPSTQIRFSLSKPSHVKLAVYDMLGREVARLADEEMDAGYHSVTWNARNVSSGVYIYKLSAGSFVQVKRMILMK